jgi:hypothetical protein
MKYKNFLRSLVAGLLALTVVCLAPAAKAVGDTNSAATLYGGGSTLLSTAALPQIQAGGTAASFSIGGTSPNVFPIDLTGSRNIGWEMTGQATNTTTALTAVFVLFNDATAIASTNNSPTNTPPLNWWTVVSNAAPSSLRMLSGTATTTGVTLSTNFNTDGYRWCIPLYVTNSAQMVSNLTLRPFIKTGF